MISCTVTKNGKGEYTGFLVKGHAGFANKGTDIVCAAASMLIINTINAMEALTDTIPEVKEKDGYLGAGFSKAPDEKAKLLMDAMVFGLNCVAEEYGNRYITVMEKEDKDA